MFPTRQWLVVLKHFLADNQDKSSVYDGALLHRVGKADHYSKGT
jgi:hypothetical protein